VTVAMIYAGLTLCILGVVPWREAMKSEFIAARFMEVLYGRWAGAMISAMVLWTALASVFALLLGYSRVPYAAAQAGFFFKPFAKLHPTGGFPHVSLLVIGALAAGCAVLNLEWVLSALLTARIVAQFIVQIGALHYMRTNRPDIHRPFRVWLYPLPSAIALAGWIFIYLTSGWIFALGGLGVLATGGAAYGFWRRNSGVPNA
jgi:basic amino acid/polyamine antiporter, APA family